MRRRYDYPRGRSWLRSSSSSLRRTSSRSHPPARAPAGTRPALDRSAPAPHRRLPDARAASRPWARDGQPVRDSRGPARDGRVDNRSTPANRRRNHCPDRAPRRAARAAAPRPGSPLPRHRYSRGSSRPHGSRAGSPAPGAGRPPPSAAARSAHTPRPAGSGPPPCPAARRPASPGSGSTPGCAPDAARPGRRRAPPRHRPGATRAASASRPSVSRSGAHQHLAPPGLHRRETRLRPGAPPAPRHTASPASGRRCGARSPAGGSARRRR